MASAIAKGAGLMSGDPALTKVLKLFATRLAAHPAAIFIDRTQGEPLLPEERLNGAIVIRATDVQLDERQELGDNAQVHHVSVDFDFYAQADSFDNIGFQHNVMIAEAIALIHTDWTLGGALYELIVQSITATVDNVPDVGVAILTLNVHFLTPFDDWTTIIGAHGPIN